MKSRTLFLFAVCAVIAGAWSCSNAKVTTPVAPTLANTSGPDGVTLKASAPLVQAPTNDIKMTSPVVILTAAPATLQFDNAGVALQYRFQVMNAAGAVVDNALVNETTYQIAATLAENSRHTWRVRAEVLGEAGPWSGLGSFITLDPALVLDPLTDGRTVGHQVGGRFIPGVGWQSTSVTNAIQYDIPTCDNCTVEFDITNIGKGEGNCCGNDLKFLSMGDANAWSSFGAFRDHPWKVQFIQRADGDGTGLEIIWRNGDAGDGNPGDHRIKMLGGGPDFRDTSVFHVVLKWTPAGYNISVGTNGGPQEEYLEDGFGGYPYAPPNHRVELGCTPRAEGFPAAIYRNVKIAKNR